jgi:gmma-aminobutyric acid receptor subunit gamma
VGHRKRSAEQDPINPDRAEVEQVESFKLHGVQNTNKLSLSKHTKTVVKRTRQHISPFKRLKRFGMGPQILMRFYRCTIESILTGCITTWYGNCSASDHKALQRVVRTAQYITGAYLPDIHDLYARSCQRKAQKIVKVSSHPSNRLFSLLMHGKRYRSANSRTKRLLYSFYPQAIRLLNN